MVIVLFDMMYKQYRLNTSPSMHLCTLFNATPQPPPPPPPQPLITITVLCPAN